MTFTEAYDMVYNFTFPVNAAFAYIYLSNSDDAQTMQEVLIASNYRTIRYNKGGEYEIVFWPYNRKPFVPLERKQKNIING